MKCIVDGCTNYFWEGAGVTICASEAPRLQWVCLPCWGAITLPVSKYNSTSAVATKWIDYAEQVKADKQMADALRSLPPFKTPDIADGPPAT